MSHPAALRSRRFSQPGFEPFASAIAEVVSARCEQMEAQEERPARSGARPAAFALLFEQEHDDDGMPTAGYGRSGSLEAAEGGYRVFTPAYRPAAPCQRSGASRAAAGITAAPG
ncbi:hypothetical protein [Paenarthrobacter sp. PH39-S1]|uniref:hypothetical protein n=1 Tax=Paenarthrobacter sp. PH39-S1 TaxID=3046204 RepID=UPI0024BAE0A6|nr:hypothetical protein [Paenarthrobacter sp. PH39-S1]MDJ0357233.1 hypothetical protein [Paenarthrobacter sp. PH39-S1]